MDVFTILILPNHEHGMFFHLFVSSLIILEQWFVVLLEEVLYILCQLYFQVFYSLCSNCEWQFILDLVLSLLLVYRNAFDFCTLILYPETLLKLLISLRRFWAEMIGSSKYTIMLSANRDNLTSSFPNQIPLIFFSCLTALARTSNTILNRSGERGHPCLVPDFIGNASNFCLFGMILAVGLSQIAYFFLRDLPSIPTLLRAFSIKGC